MFKKCIIFICMILLMGTASLSRAETVYLKNGKKVKGKIMERKQNFIKMMSGGRPYMYFIDEIEKIVDDDIEDLSIEALSEREERPLSEIPQGKKDLILRLMDYNGARVSIAKTFKDILTNLEPEQAEIYVKLFDVNEIIDEAIPIYDKYYSEDELIEMINFYSSPVGQKLIKATPVAFDETAKKIIKYFNKKGAE